MTKEDIAHLGTLARIHIDEAETMALAADITKIVDYVGVISDVVGEQDRRTELTPVYNVLREDEPAPIDEDKEARLLDAMPERKGRYLQVKQVMESKKK